MAQPEMYVEPDRDEPNPRRPLDPHNPLADLLDRAWGLISSAGGGNWETQDPEWIRNAQWWRDQWGKATPPSGGRWEPLLSPEKKTEIRQLVVDAAAERKMLMDYYSSLGLDQAGLLDLVVQRHMDHTGACEQVYKMWMAAMGYEGPGQFQPPAQGNPADQIRAERQRLIELSKRKPGEVVEDGGVTGVLVRCTTCGEGLLFQPDVTEERIAPQEPTDA